MRVNETYRSLLDKSIGSMLSAIEIYNKPDFQYREDIFAILAVNAWELLLKAQLFRINKFKMRTIYELHPATNKDGSKAKRKMEVAKNRCGNPKTLSINDVLSRLEVTGSIKPNLRGNIEALIELRDNAIHFINTKQIPKQIQELGFACIKNYISIIKEWKIDIDLSSYNFYLMPLAYVDGRKMVEGTLTTETANYINLIKNKLSQVDVSDHDYDIAISIDVDFKKGNSFDAIGVSYATDGIKVSLSEENMRQRFPWTRQEVIEKCKTRYSDFKQNQTMRDIFKEIQANPKLSYQRRLYPTKPRPMTYLYSSNVLQEFDKHYTKS